MYTIDDLIRESGYSRSMIYYFRKKRLLPPPMHRRNMDRAVWGPQHLKRLRQIRAIQDQNRTLDDIRDMLESDE